MNDVFIEIFNERFNNQFTIEADKIGSFIRFPAKNPDFGDIIIYEEVSGQYTVEVGKITHCHFYHDAVENTVKGAAIEIADFLVNLFADRIICYERGCCEAEHETEHDKEFIDWISKCDKYVWSGLYKKATEKK